MIVLLADITEVEVKNEKYGIRREMNSADKVFVVGHMYDNTKKKKVP